jgi:hypothetical protein
LIDVLKSNQGKFPSDDDKDLIGAIAALLRLQSTYNITARTMIEGNIPGEFKQNILLSS